METFSRTLTRKDKFNLAIQILLGFFTIIVGTLFILRDTILWVIIYWMMIILLIGNMLFFVYRGVQRKSLFDILIALGAVVFVILIWMREDLYVEIMAIVFGFWALFNGAVHLLEVLVAFKEKQRIIIIKIIQCLFSIIMASLLFNSGIKNRFLMNIQIGIYIIFFGAVTILSGIRVLWKHQTRVRLSAPVILTAFNPYFLVKDTNHKVQENPEYVSNHVEKTLGNYISIYIYAKDHGYNRMGHLDIGYNGSIYSYGAHDPYNRAKTMAYGDGVMIVGSETDYVQFAVDDDTTVIRFLCELNEKQNDHVIKRIDELFSDAYYFKWPYERDTRKEHHLTHLIDKGAHVDFYKFNSGKFKTYNVFTTNCVLIADHIVESTGMKLFQMSGIITPGAYYDYLENLLNKPGSIVVKKEIYKKTN